jgi:predicted nucleotidyltransferase
MGVIMKLCAIICEYNPLHFGHWYHIQKAKELSGCDGVLCIMSGNFTQRAEPTITDKYVRASMALNAGADIVVQMPTAYACSSAEIYALAGIKIANSFKNVTHISFGCECENSELLKELANYLADEPEEYKEALKKYLDEGNSIVLSRQKAIEQLVKEEKVTFSNITEAVDALHQPNNILALEYLKALKRTNSKIEPVFVARGCSDYHSEDINGKDTSATAIRSRLLKKEKVRSVKRLMPKFSYELLKDHLKDFGLPSLELFNDICMFKLKTSSKDTIKNVYDVKEGLENRFFECAKEKKVLNEVLLDVKSKRYTYTRLKRIVLQLVLDINKAVIDKLYEIDKLPYIKVLGFSSENPQLLSEVSADTDLIVRNNNVVDDPSEFYLELAGIEDRANALYNLLLKKSRIVPKYSPDLLTKTIKF